MADPQTNLRDVFLRTAFDALDLGNPTDLVKAACAAMGASAVFIAMMPDGSRENAVEQLGEALQATVDQRRREIVSGDFDRYMDRRQ